MWNFWINHHRWADCVYPNVLVKLFYHGHHIICISHWWWYWLQMAHSKWLTNLWMAFVWKTNIFKDVDFPGLIIIRVLNYFVVSPISYPFCTRKTIQKKLFYVCFWCSKFRRLLLFELSHWQENQHISIIIKSKTSLTLLQTFWGFLQFQSFSFSPIDILMI